MFTPLIYEAFRMEIPILFLFFVVVLFASTCPRTTAHPLGLYKLWKTF
jgi:hypothetical protein